MSAPEKRSGFSQGIYAISSTKKERIGTKRTLQDGRVFRYARAGASAALSPAFLGFATQTDADYQYKACPASVAVGAREMTLTIGAASPAIAANFFENGVFIVGAGTGLGEVYPIEGNSAVDASGTSIVVTLKEPLRTALTSAAYFRLVPSPWQTVVESATEENLPVGTPLVSVTAAYYYWSQTKGLGAARIKAKRGKAQTTLTLLPMMQMIPSVSAGWISPIAQTAGTLSIPVGKPVVAIYCGDSSSVSTQIHAAVPVIWDIPG
jgi:hypothetical protein